MHVLIVHQAFAAGHEAGGTRHFEFARHLVARGHRVTVIAGRTSYLTGRDLADVPGAADGVTIVRPYTSRSLHRSFLHRAVSYLTFALSSAIAACRVRDVDVVFGTSPPILQGATAWFAARTRRVPFVFEVRDLWPDFAIELGLLRNGALVAAARALERFLYRSADGLLVNSPGFVSHVQAVAGRRPVLIPNGVDAAQFDGADGARFRASWQADGRFVVLYAGAHGVANSLETIIDAAAQLQARSSALFVFVGDGKEKRALEARAADLALRNVRFEPAHSKDDMPAVIAAADGCVATLRDIPLFRTTYPNKVFDYMAAAKPTILAIDGVIREVIEQSGGGVFVPPGDARALADAVLQLEADPDACARMGANARAYVRRQFNREDQAAAFCTLLRECAEARGGPIEDAPVKRHTN